MVSSPESGAHRHQTPTGADGEGSGGGGIKEQDRLLPIANVGRIMKQILPPTSKVSKEAKETVQECVSEFISFVTGEASDRCRKEKRKTVNGDDICWALATLGFDDYAEPMRRYLRKYREAEGDRAVSASASGSNRGTNSSSNNPDADAGNPMMFNVMGRSAGSSSRQH